MIGWRRALPTLRVIGITVVMTVAYTNCGPFKADSGNLNMLSSTCGGSLLNTFSRSYYPVLTKWCSSCHNVANGETIPFADPDLGIAFSQFYGDGTDGIGLNEDRLNALKSQATMDPPHKSGTGPALIPHIEQADAVYQKGLSAYLDCTDQAPDVSDTALTKAITILGDDGNQNQPQTRTFNLASDLVSRKIAGATFSVQTQRQAAADGNPAAYLISAPTLKAGNKALQVERIDVYFNGQLLAAATTFRAIVDEVPAGETKLLVPADASPMVIQPEGGIKDSDTIAFEFRVLTDR